MSCGTASRLPLNSVEVKEPRLREPSASPRRAEVEVLREERRMVWPGTARNWPAPDPAPVAAPALPTDTLELRLLASCWAQVRRGEVVVVVVVVVEVVVVVVVVVVIAAAVVVVVR